jgi:hypothetical protein
MSLPHDYSYDPVCFMIATGSLLEEVASEAKMRRPSDLSGLQPGPAWFYSELEFCSRD